jgi:hypothetical protein
MPLRRIRLREYKLRSSHGFQSSPTSLMARCMRVKSVWSGSTRRAAWKAWRTFAFSSKSTPFALDGFWMYSSSRSLPSARLFIKSTSCCVSSAMASKIPKRSELSKNVVVFSGVSAPYRFTRWCPIPAQRLMASGQHTTRGFAAGRILVDLVCLVQVEARRGTSLPSLLGGLQRICGRWGHTEGPRENIASAPTLGPVSVTPCVTRSRFDCRDRW